MQELYQQLIAMLYGIWRKRWYAVAVTYVVCALGWGYVATIANTYESSARIYVDTETLLRPLMEGIAVEVDINRRVDLLHRTLTSRPNLEKVIRRADLDLDLETDDELEQLINDVRERIGMGVQGNNLFVLTYESGDPALSDAENAALAKRVVQQLLTIFVESQLGRSREDLMGARRFIDEQLQEYERQLQEAERRRAEFDRRYMDVLSNNQDYVTTLQEARSNLSDTEAQLGELREVQEQLAAQLEKLSPFVVVAGGQAGGGGSAGSGTLNARIQEIERQIDAMKLRGYTDKHPDVVSAKRQIEALKEERQQEQEAMLQEMEGQGGNPNVTTSEAQMPNPLYEQVMMRVVENQSKIAQLNARRKEQLEQLNRLQEKASQIPQIESERAKLNRDYEVLKNRYQSLVERREQARMAQDLETKSDNVNFRVIDPPSEPLEPSKPNRPLLLSLVLFLGVGAGVGSAFVVSQLKSTFVNVQKLRDSFALPVLGSVSLITSEQARRQQAVWLGAFSISVIMLLVTYGLLMAVELIQTSVV